MSGSIYRNFKQKETPYWTWSWIEWNWFNWANRLHKMNQFCRHYRVWWLSMSFQFKFNLTCKIGDFLIFRINSLNNRRVWKESSTVKNLPTSITDFFIHDYAFLVSIASKNPLTFTWPSILNILWGFFIQARMNCDLENTFSHPSILHPAWCVTRDCGSRRESISKRWKDSSQRYEYHLSGSHGSSLHQSYLTISPASKLVSRVTCLLGCFVVWRVYCGTTHSVR